MSATCKTLRIFNDTRLKQSPMYHGSKINKNVGMPSVGNLAIPEKIIANKPDCIIGINILHTEQSCLFVDNIYISPKLINNEMSIIE